MAEDYVAGHLGGAEQEAFELHFFECPQCLAEVRALQLSKAVLEQDESLRGEAPAPTEARSHWLRWAALAAAAALAILFVRLQFPGPVEGPAEPVALTEEAAPATGLDTAEHLEAEAPGDGELQDAAMEDRREMLIASLVEFDPPPYERVVLRGVADEASRQFERGMVAYLESDFETALGFLRAATESDPDRPDIAFYHGVSMLLTGDLEEAIRELTRTVNLDDPVFDEEARYYLAKAHLRFGDLEKAREELTRVVAMGGVLATEAAKILQQLELLP